MKKQGTAPKTREELFAEKAEKSYAVCYSETCPLYRDDQPIEFNDYVEDYLW